MITDDFELMENPEDQQLYEGEAEDELTLTSRKI